MTNKIILGAEGLNGKNPISPEEIKICESWIQKHIETQKTINKKQGSYSLKEMVEKENDVYISNGAFIQAAINLNYKYQKSHRSEKNVFFDMKLKK